MKKLIFNLICKAELFAERVYYLTGLEIFPPKWRVAVEERFNPIPANVLSDYLAAGGDVSMFIDLQEARK